MFENTVYFTTVVAIIIFAFCNILLLKFSDMVLLFPRLSKWVRIPFVLLNSAIITVAMISASSNTFFTYIMIYVLFFLDLKLLYRDTAFRCLCIASIYMLHIMTFRSICVAVYSMQTGISFYETVNDLVHLSITTALTFIFISIAIIIIKKLVPPNKIKFINRYPEQIKFLTYYMLAINIYLILVSNIYSVYSEFKYLNQAQIFSSLSIIVSTYLVFIFAVKTSSLLGYKDKISELQEAISKEQQFKNTITNDSIMTYEYSVTNNQFITDCSSYFSKYKIEVTDYNTSVALLSKKIVHPDDYDAFISTVLTTSLLKQYANGKTEIYIDYRRLVERNIYIWVRSTTYLIYEQETDTIKGLTCIKNVNEEKLIQLEMQFKAESDSLTGLYNKGMTIKLINDRLSVSSKNASYAMYIIDVDNFKEVNDNLGHTFGDAVLCELSEKLNSIFVSGDIVGRVGGDEFLAFTKNAYSIEYIKERADEIIKSFYKIYSAKNDIDFNISASVGISLFPKDGSNYDQLFKSADVALYNSKNTGKNTHTVFNGEEFTGYKSNRTEIDAFSKIPQKSFKNNRMEYIFKILYDSENPYAAIQTALELLTSHFTFSRGYIFEITADGKYTSNSFEWCVDGIEPQIDILQDVNLNVMETATDHFRKTGVFIIHDIIDLPPNEHDILAKQGIQSMLQFGYFDNGQLRGFVGFDDCINVHRPTEIEIDEISTVCRVLSTFLFKQRAIEKANANATCLETIMNNLDSFAYVIDAKTFDVLFLNEKTKQIVPKALTGEKCHLAFRSYDDPCSDCPIKDLDNSIGASVIKEIYNAKLDVWTETTASIIDWIDGKTACLINCIDITKYKNYKDE